MTKLFQSLLHTIIAGVVLLIAIVSGWTNVLLIAFAVIIGGTLLGEHTATFGERYTADKGPGDG